MKKIKKIKSLNIEITTNNLIKKDKGAISIFVLVGLLFMTAFLIILYGYNINKSKIVDEQFEIISGIYSQKNSDEVSYTDIYTDLRNKNKQILTASSENTEDTANLELTKTFEGNLSNYRIYGNSIQNGTPSVENPIEILSVGENEDITLINRGKNYINEKVEWQASSGVNQTFSNGIWTFENTDESNGTYLYYYVTLKPGTYTYSVKGLSSSQITIYDITNSNTVATFNTGSTESTSFTLSEKAEIRITGGYVDALSTLTMNNVQLEEGSQVTSYEPYQKSAITLKLLKPLRKVGDYVDYLDYKSGKVIRNVGKIDSYNGETITTSWISTTGGLDIGATVYYGLEDPEEENVSLSEFKVFEDNNKIEVSTTIAPSKIEVEYVGYTLD